jgi:uncharacterized integral membrane protein
MPLVYLLIVAGAVAIAVFAVQNADQVTIRFLVWRIERAPLAAVILLSGGVGGILAGLIGFVQRWKLRSKVRQLETRLRGLEATKPD